jgi:phosphatidylserine/phosphatidylglycerophosphate/cardiolipin synthase-like enzyme
MRSTALSLHFNPSPAALLGGLHACDTRRVYEELLGSAERSVWASTYAFFDGPIAFEVLARRMDVRSELRVTLLLNIQRKRGDTTAAEQLVRRFADRLWKTDWPGSSRPSVHYDPRSLEPERPAGVLHAKAVVADDEAVFVTSANFTEAALDRNIEIGLLVRDRALAASVTSHFRGLIDRGLLRPLPMM